jgi:transposase
MSLIKNYSSDQIKEMMYSVPEYKEGIKLFAAYLATKGWSSRKLESLFDISFKQITVWLHEFDESGIEGLKEKPKPGRNSKLDDTQKAELKEIIRNKTPQDFGISEKKWKGEAVAAVIEKQFGITYKKAQIYNIINSLNIQDMEQ